MLLVTVTAVGLVTSSRYFTAFDWNIGEGAGRKGYLNNVTNPFADNYTGTHSSTRTSDIQKRHHKPILE